MPPPEPYLEQQKGDVAERARATSEQAERRAQAAAAKKAFDATIRGAQLRAADLQRVLLGPMAFAGALLAVMQVVNGQVQIKTAKEAADVARALVEIGRLEHGDPSAHHTELTPEERTAKIETAKRLGEELRQRAEAEQASLDADLDGPQGPNSRGGDSPPGSVDKPAVLRSVPAMTPTPTTTET